MHNVEKVDISLTLSPDLPTGDWGLEWSDLLLGYLSKFCQGVNMIILPQSLPNLKSQISNLPDI